MFWNNLKIALRNLRKNKLFAFINISGLTLGLTVYVFGNLLVEYEKTHDLFFKNVSRTYTVGSNIGPGLDVGVKFIGSTFSALGPLIKAEISDVEFVARAIEREFLVKADENGFYQGIRFADPDLLRIFDFKYIHGDETALDDPSGILITEETAIKYFGDTNVLGRVLTMDNEFDFHVSAVIREVPLNSHFNAVSIIDTTLELIAPLKALGRMRDYDQAGNWNNLSPNNLTYILVAEGLGQTWFQNQLDSIYERVVPEDVKELVTGFIAQPLQHTNLVIWDMIGLPVIAVVQLLCLLVLIVACVNYTNLATAQSLGRSREVGMRKTMGAGRGQLLTQFLVESLTIAAIAMIVAVAALELLIPLFNNAANKILTLDYLGTLPWLIVTTILVGLIAGAYPAWLITRASPIDALRDTARKGKKGSRVRALMIGAQFSISAFMLALVSVVFMQNERVKEASQIFPRSEIYTLDRLNVESIRDRLETLQNELQAIPGVERVTFSGQVPFEQENAQMEITAQPGDESGKFMVNRLRMWPGFLDAYNIPLLAGRNLSRDMAADEQREESEVLNVLVNELTLDMLGIRSPAEAINKRLYDLNEDNSLREMVIVGVVPTQNILGVFNKEKPWVYFFQNNARIGSIRISGGNMSEVIREIENTWKRVIPDYPIQGRFLDAVFEETFSIMKYMNMALAGFAFMALALALIGLFGLAAFMTAQRTREIGVRKVLGANSFQIVKLLVWQFSRPVMWALVVALPAAFFASSAYLNFFADRIESPVIILVFSGLMAVLLAWLTVAGHAVRISRASPIIALRYE